MGKTFLCHVSQPSPNQRSRFLRDWYEVFFSLPIWLLLTLVCLLLCPLSRKTHRRRLLMPETHGNVFASTGWENAIWQLTIGCAEVWHPQISQSQSWDHYQPITLRICWVSQLQWIWNQTQPLTLSKLPLQGSKGLTVFGGLNVFIIRICSF